MVKRVLVCSLVASVLVSACSTSTSNNNVAATAANTGNPPVETQPPNSDYKPAFAGQTRIAKLRQMKSVNDFRFGCLPLLREQQEMRDEPYFTNFAMRPPLPAK